MKWFKTSTDTLHNELNSSVKNPVSVEVTKNSSIITVTFKDYLYSQLKDTLNTVVQIIKKHKVKNPTLIISLSSTDVKIYLNPLKDNPYAAVDLLESIKARVPSARNLTVSTRKIRFDIEDVTLAPKTVASLGVMFAEHFKEELLEPVTVSVGVAGRLSLKYSFKLIEIETITETIVNSNRYSVLMEFLLQNPHPDVEKFKFEFRDENKGYFAIMNLNFNKPMNVKEEYEVSNFIRNRIATKFTHLGLY